MQAFNNRHKALAQQVAVGGQQARKENAGADQADTAALGHKLFQRREKALGVVGYINNTRECAGAPGDKAFVEMSCDIPVQPRGIGKDKFTVTADFIAVAEMRGPDFFAAGATSCSYGFDQQKPPAARNIGAEATLECAVVE